MALWKRQERIQQMAFDQCKTLFEEKSKNKVYCRNWYRKCTKKKVKMKNMEENTNKTCLKKTNKEKI